MGLFDALFSGLESKTTLSPQESFAGILLSSAACDGHISEDEFGQFITTLFRMKLFRRVNEKQIQTVLNRLMGLIKKKGPETVLEYCCETLPKELYRPAFANACNIVLADGILDPEEKDFINTLAIKLDLDKKLAKTIVQVMIIKNKG